MQIHSDVVMEMDWQVSFLRDGEVRVVVEGEEGDPWATITLGSEEWEVKMLDGYLGSHNGRLCRTGKGVCFRDMLRLG